MSAAGPKPSSSRLPQDTALPPSPSKPLRRTRGKKGKGKEDVGPSTPQRVPDEHSGIAQEDEEGETPETEWIWTSLTDPGFSRVPPLFTRDGSYFFSIVGPLVKIHSAATGQVISTLSSAPSRAAPHSPRGHGDLITGAVINPDNAFQLITGSLDGTIKIWDFLDAVLLRTIDLKQAIFQLCAHEKFKGYVFVSAARPTKRKNKSGVEIEDNVAVLRVSLRPTDATAQSKIATSGEITSFGKTRFIRGLGVSASGDWLVAIGGHKSYVAKTESPKAGFTKFVSPERLMCLAFHPTEDHFATGDDKGIIRSWYCLQDDLVIKTVGVERRAQTTTFHWHAHAVSSLAFTPNGAYLLSGGEESVLVIWQLHSGKKEFVPRVGAPISTIAVLKAVDREEEYVLGLTDASYVFVSSATMKISRVFSRIKLDPLTPQLSLVNRRTPLAVHSRSSTLILPSSHPSTLQTYSPSSLKVVSELEVSPSNRVSRREETPVEPSRVENCVLSPQGDWMATLDVREGDDNFRGDICLKMWRWDWKAGFWILNSRIDRPHGLRKVTSLTFNPASQEDANLLLATTGEDGLVKTWRIRSTKLKMGEAEDFWVTRSTFSFRSETPSHASWSLDGSLLSITFGSSVVLYEPFSSAIRATLTAPECTLALAAHFIGRSGRFLLVVGALHLFLWDLLTQTIRWHRRLPDVIQRVVPHVHEEMFAVLTHPSSDPQKQSSRILLFQPASPKHVRIRTLPFRIRTVAWYTLQSLAEKGSFSLVAVTHTWSVVLLGDEVHAPDGEGATLKELGCATIAGAGPSRTLFQDMFGDSAFADFTQERPLALTSTQPLTMRTWEGSSIAKLLNAPAYLLPPLETLFDSVMNGFLQERAEDAGDNAAVVDHDGDDESEGKMDVEETILTVNPRKDRIVDGQEMGMFIELFRQHAVKAPSMTRALPLASARMNGMPTHNGPSPENPKLNGHHRPVATPAQPYVNGATLRTEAQAPKQRADVALPSPVEPTGKKRKKSLSS